MRTLKILDRILKSSGRGQDDRLLVEMLKNCVLQMGSDEYKYIGDGLVQQINSNHITQLQIRKINGIRFLDSKTKDTDLKVSVVVNGASLLLDLSDKRLLYIFQNVLLIDESSKFLNVSFKSSKLELKRL